MQLTAAFGVMYKHTRAHRMGDSMASPSSVSVDSASLTGPSSARRSFDGRASPPRQEHFNQHHHHQQHQQQQQHEMYAAHLRQQQQEQYRQNTDAGYHASGQRDGERPDMSPFWAGGMAPDHPLAPEAMNRSMGQRMNEHAWSAANSSADMSTSAFAYGNASLGGADAGSTGFSMTDLQDGGLASVPGTAAGMPAGAVPSILERFPGFVRYEAARCLSLSLHELPLCSCS